VPLTIGERDQHVKLGLRQWEERLRRLGAHDPTISYLAILYSDIVRGHHRARAAQ
jgi:hypothetical protein